MMRTRPTDGVIPAKAGTSVCYSASGTKTEIPAFAGMTAGGEGVAHV
jgi:hypothetical protein